MNGIIRTPVGVAGGAAQLLRGFRLLRQPGVRMFVVIPLCINLVVFGGLIWLVGDRFDALLDYVTPQLPEWLAWLAWLAWVLFAVLAALLVFYTFTLLANLISAPFNGFLAERVARHLGVEPPETQDKRSLWQEIWADIRQELRKIGYFLSRAAGLALLSLVLLFVPLLNAIIPLLWFLFGAWMLALEYSDFHLANQGYRFEQERQLLRSNLGTSLGFGAMTALATLVPFVNFLVMPAAVAGATALWCERLPASDKRPSIPS
ncbi:MAG: sulfate transporter CysZ [Proteobacteria bacterium]|nr:sulfate transporter CysZ [Pseudomonadota bacterium]